MRSDKRLFMRGASVIVLVTALAFLVACGGNSTSLGSGGGAVTIGLLPSATTLTQGQSATVNAVVSSGGVTWSVSPASFGALSGQTSTSVTYTAPTTVTTATVVTITATSTTQAGIVAPLQISVRASPTIALSTGGPQTINQNQLLSINATLTGDTTNQGVSWSLSPSVGSLSNVTISSVTYTAPSVVSSTPVTLTATSVANPNSTTSLELTVVASGAAANLAAVTTSGGPTPPSTNTFFTSVTVCVPATSNCQTVDNILVDTGSEGLRILQSALPSIVLPQLGDGGGNYLNNCVSFLDTSYLWGPVAQADVKIGAETASSALIQVVSSLNTGVPDGCSNGGSVNENTPALLGANGILGVGLEPTDCTQAGGNFCDGSIQGAPDVYFACPTSGCVATDGPVLVSAANQVVNPIVLFGSDNNGVALKLPALPGSATAVNGSMIFGVGTQSNNALGAATVFVLDGNDNFITSFSGQTLTASFIDSGSNGLFFPSTLTACTVSSGFYCPATQQSLSATNEDANGANPSIVPFKIDNADTLFSNPNDSAFGTLGGPLGTVNTCSGGNGSCTFDWGAPFFYGRTVFTAIDGQTTPAGFGPFWAY
jgi:Protein of unknown function (DUF3443)